MRSGVRGLFDDNFRCGKEIRKVDEVTFEFTGDCFIVLQGHTFYDDAGVIEDQRGNASRVTELNKDVRDRVNRFAIHSRVCLYLDTQRTEIGGERHPFDSRSDLMSYGSDYRLVNDVRHEHD